MLPSGKSIRETSIPLPTLSTKGWVYGLNDKIDMIYAYYLTSQHSQTVHHKTYVKSLQYTVQEHFNDPNRLCQVMESEIHDLISPFVDYVTVKVDHEPRADGGPEYDVTIRMDITHQGYHWENFKAVTMKESKFHVINDINTTGKVSLTSSGDDYAWIRK